MAVLVSALVLAYATPHVTRVRSRLQTFAFWDLTTFVFNGAMGVRRRANAEGGARYRGRRRRNPPRRIAGFCHHRRGRCDRFAFSDLLPSSFVLLDRREVQRTRRVGWRQRDGVPLGGFPWRSVAGRGVAVPLTTHSGAPFPDRNLIIFVVCVVILVTVLVQGGTLSDVVRWAGCPKT